MADSRRKQKSLIAMQIDFSNAFGSGLAPDGFPPDFVEPVEDLYTGATFTISLPTGDTDQIPWTSRVKQGCRYLLCFAMFASNRC
jgi:hypothetical protein